jgi:hypothetical protein
VIPGIIDIHTHYDIETLCEPALSESLRRGVTTVMLGSGPGRIRGRAGDPVRYGSPGPARPSSVRRRPRAPPSRHTSILGLARTTPASPGVPVPEWKTPSTD